MLACGRCIDLKELYPEFARNIAANASQRQRISEDLLSRQLSQKILGIYSRFDPTASTLTWSRGRLRDFVKACFTDLALMLPTDSQIYKMYTHFDPELNMSLTALESICLVEALIRASVGIDMETIEPIEPIEPIGGPIGHSERDNTSLEFEPGFDHPTFLAEQWVSQYVPLPVDGTVSIAYSTGVAIHFEDFSRMLQSLAALNASQRSNILYKIASCDLLKHALEIFRRHDDDGFLTSRQLEGFVTEVFVSEGLVPPTAEHVAAFYDKFAGPQQRLNASECLCLVDALFRALLHAGTPPSQRLAASEAFIED